MIELELMLKKETLIGIAKNRIDANELTSIDVMIHTVTCTVNVLHQITIIAT